MQLPTININRPNSSLPQKSRSESNDTLITMRPKLKSVDIANFQSMSYLSSFSNTANRKVFNSL